VVVRHVFRVRAAAGGVEGLDTVTRTYGGGQSGPAAS
jgi:hypothetical protein